MEILWPFQYRTLLTSHCRNGGSMTQAALQEEAEEAEEALGLSNLLVGLQLLEDRLGTIPPLGQCAGDDTPRLTKSFPKGQQLCLSCDVTRRFDHRFLPCVNCRWCIDRFGTSVIMASHSHKSCDAHVILEGIKCPRRWPLCILARPYPINHPQQKSHQSSPFPESLKCTRSFQLKRLTRSWKAGLSQTLHGLESLCQGGRSFECHQEEMAQKKRLFKGCPTPHLMACYFTNNQRIVAFSFAYRRPYIVSASQRQETRGTWGTWS